MKKVITLIAYLHCIVLFAFACTSEQCHKPKIGADKIDIDIGRLVNVEDIQCCEVKRESGKVDAYAQALIDEFYPLNVEQNQADLADFFFTMKERVQINMTEYRDCVIGCEGCIATNDGSTPPCPPCGRICTVEDRRATFRAEMRLALEIQACAIQECERLGKYIWSHSNGFGCLMNLDAALTSRRA